MINSLIKEFGGVNTVLIRIEQTSTSVYGGTVDSEAQKIFKPKKMIRKRLHENRIGDYWKEEEIEVIEIDSLGNLFDKLKAYGSEFVISPTEYMGKTDLEMPVLEIYDYYRE